MPPFSAGGGRAHARPRGTAGVIDSPVVPLQSQRGVSPIASIHIPNFTPRLQEEPNTHDGDTKHQNPAVKKASMIHSQY